MLSKINLFGFYFFSALAIIGLCFFAYPNPWFNFPPFILILLIILHHSILTKRRWKVIYLFSSLGFAGVLYWLYYPCYVYGGIPLLVSFCFPILMGLYLGLYVLVYALIISWVRPYLSFFELSWFGASLWMGLAIIREFLFSGFPWVDLAVCFAPYPYCLQILRLVGANGFAFFIILLCFWSLNKKYWLGVVGIILFLIGVNFFPLNLSGTHSLNVGLVQASIEQEHKWDEKFQKNTLHTYIKLSHFVRRPDLIVWPETCMPFYFQEVNSLSNQLKQFVRLTQVNLLFGAPGYKFVSKDHYLLFNRAYLLNAQGQVLGFYEKEKLVPFGEYIPFSFLKPLFGFFSAGVGEFTPGKVVSPLYLNKNLALGVLICYEAIFPALAEKRVKQGGNILINISNDAWFGQTSAPYQHLYLAVLRAIEQQRYLVRATNSGISVIIDPRGNIMVSLGIFKRGHIQARVKAIASKSFFNRYFIFFYTFPFGLILIFLGIIFYRRSYGVVLNGGV